MRHLGRYTPFIALVLLMAHGQADAGDHVYVYRNWEFGMGKDSRGKPNPRSGLVLKAVGPEEVIAGQTAVFRIYLLPYLWDDVQRADRALKASASIYKWPHIRLTRQADAPLSMPAVVMVAKRGSVTVADEPIHYGWTPYSQDAVKDVMGTAKAADYQQGWKFLRPWTDSELKLLRIFDALGKAIVEKTPVGKVALALADIIEFILGRVTPSAMETYRETHHVYLIPVLETVVRPHPAETAHRIEVPLVFNQQGDTAVRLFPHLRLSAQGPDLGGCAHLPRNAAVTFMVHVQAGSAKPWMRPGTHAGHEITGPHGGKLVWVPGGSFMMGECPGSRGRRVELSGFWIGKTEVTVGQWRSVMGSVPGGNRLGDSHPVVNVSWFDCQKFCKKVGLSLPTQAQWEYAARGPQSHRYPWGDVWDESKCCSWSQSSLADGVTCPVGSHPTGASWCGALDMAGNAWEWCMDWNDDDYYYRTGPTVDPPGPREGSLRVVRGGQVTEGGAASIPRLVMGNGGFRVAGSCR